MDDTWFIPLWIQLAILLIVIAGLVAFVVPRVASHLKGTGGWNALATHYAVAPRKIDGVLQRQTLMVGQVLWRRCAIIGVIDDGLYLAVKPPLPFLGKPPLLIPWTAIQSVEAAELFWGESCPAHHRTAENRYDHSSRRSLSSHRTATASRTRDQLICVHRAHMAESTANVNSTLFFP